MPAGSASGIPPSALAARVRPSACTTRPEVARLLVPSLFHICFASTFDIVCFLQARTPATRVLNYRSPFNQGGYFQPGLFGRGKAETRFATCFGPPATVPEEACKGFVAGFLSQAPARLRWHWRPLAAPRFRGVEAVGYTFPGEGVFDNLYHLPLFAGGGVAALHVLAHRKDEATVGEFFPPGGSPRTAGFRPGLPVICVRGSVEIAPALGRVRQCEAPSFQPHPIFLARQG